MDTYGAHVSRDIEPSVEGGSVMYDIMSSCMRVVSLARAGLLKLGAHSSGDGLCGGADVRGEQCCTIDPSTEDFVTVFAAVSGSWRLSLRA